VDCPPLRFNPQARLERVDVEGQAICFVLDQALLDPERLVEYAVAEQSRFQQAPFNAYPGREMPMPAGFTAGLEQAFNGRVRSLLGGRRTLRTTSRLAMVTTAPADLEPRQRICHRDSAWIEPTHAIAASVLYLFQDPVLGGTGFYWPRRSEQEIAQLVHDSSTLDRATFDGRHPDIAQDFMRASNDWFERIGGVAAAWNRMIFYDGRLFHSGEIGPPARMLADPRQGRLTLNGFFTCSRPAR
jgi:hypothetical protein